MTTKDRIENDADSYLNALEYRGAISESEMKDSKNMYVAGATIERNKTIDECINIIDRHSLSAESRMTEDEFIQVKSEMQLMKLNESIKK